MDPVHCPDLTKFVNLPWLKDRTIFLTQHGSRAYGTSLPTSDTDYKGVAIPPTPYFTGFTQKFEQAESSSPDDMVIYEVRKFMALARDCNPNIIEVLWTDPSNHVMMTTAGRMLVDARDMFLSKKARHTFSGYAMAQLHRLQSHYRWLKNPPLAPPRREDFGLRPENEMTGAQRENLSVAMSMVIREVATWHDLDWTSLDASQSIALRNRMTDFLARMKVSSEDVFANTAKSLGMDDNLIALLVQEKAYRAKKQDWDSYQTWLRSRNPARAAIEAKYGYDCYLDDTEFLTSRGWLRYDEVVDGDTLATLNQSTGHIEYQAFTDRVAKPHTGPVVFLHPQHSNCAVTMNHRMWVSRVHRTGNNGFSTAYTHRSAEWTIRPMGDLLDGRPSYFHVRVTGTPRHTDYPIPDDLLTLMGCYVSEGCVGKSLTDGTPSVLRISQKAGGRLEPHMDGFMSRYPARVRRFSYLRDEESRTTPCEERVWTVADRQWAGDVVTWCGSGSQTKHLPPWAVQLSARQVDLLLDVMVAGDGSNRPHSRIYHTSSKRLADDVQAMCVSAGIVSQVWGPYGDANATPMYQVYVGQRHEAVTACFREEGSNHVTVEEVQGGRIVCFTVPNEILVTRRGGKVAIQGNTKHAMHLVRLLRMCREILTTGKVIVRRPDAEELLGIRAGWWSYEALVEWATKQDQEMDALYESSNLPHSPNMKMLDRLCMSLVGTMTMV